MSWFDAQGLRSSKEDQATRSFCPPDASPSDGSEPLSLRAKADSAFGLPSTKNTRQANPDEHQNANPVGCHPLRHRPGITGRRSRQFDNSPRARCGHLSPALPELDPRPPLFSGLNAGRMFRSGPVLRNVDPIGDNGISAARFASARQSPSCALNDDQTTNHANRPGTTRQSNRWSILELALARGRRGLIGRVPNRARGHSVLGRV